MKKAISIAITLLMLMSGMLVMTGGSTGSENNSYISSAPENPEPMLTSHAPIWINNNSDLASAASSGSGTQTDPYIIENYDISNPHGCAIYINHTTSHFIIRNCSLHDSENGIYFFEVSNGQIYNNTIYNNMNGTYLEWLTNSNIFFHNNFINNTWQATDESDGGNAWHNNQLCEGNYWSDYSGEDAEGDSNYFPGADGIGDQPYELDCCSSADDYPLMVPWGSKDTDKPHVVITSPSNNTIFGPYYYDAGFIEIYWNGEDDSTGINHYEVKLDHENWTYVPIYSFDICYYGIDEIDQGSHTFSVKAIDAFGNENVSTVYFTVDFTAPIVNITHASFSSGRSLFNTSSGQICLNWTGYDDISGVSSYAIGLGKEYESPGEIRWNDLGMRNNYCFNFSRLSDGYYYLYIGAMDKAGNGYRNADSSYEYELYGCDSVGFRIDTTAPYITIYTPNEHSYVDDSVSISWSARDHTDLYYDDGSGIDFYEIRIDNGTWNNTGENTTYSFSNLSEGSHTVEVRATDRAGNENTEKVTFTVDLSKPTINITSPANDAVFGTGEVTVWWIGNDVLSGIGHYEVRIDSGPWQNAGNNSSYFFRGLSDGFHTIDVKAVDVVGNYNITSVTFSVGYGIISGKVVDENGNPIANATVTLDSGQSAVTDENGVFRIIATKGAHTVTIAKSGYETQAVDTSVNSGETTNLHEVSLASPSNANSGDLTWILIFVGVLGLAAIIFMLLVYKGIIDPENLMGGKSKKKGKK